MIILYFCWSLSGTDLHTCSEAKASRWSEERYFYMKGLWLYSSDWIRDWFLSYWLTPHRHTYHLVSQSCCHRNDPAIIEARRSLDYSFRATCGPWQLFSVKHTDAAWETTLSPTEARTQTMHLLNTGCYAITSHKVFEDSACAILSFRNYPCHSWWQSNNHPERPETFKHLNFALMKSAKLTSWITMRTHCFFHMKT